MNAEQAKFLADYYAGVFEREMPTTASVLAAVNQGDRDYKPDPKSRSAWEIATHLAYADTWLLQSILDGKFEYNPEAAKKTTAQFKDAEDIAAFYRKTLPDRLTQLRAAPAETLVRPLDFYGIMNGPAVTLLTFVQHHSIHHRGQLAAYLRAMGSKVPNIYGPSADTKPATT